MCNTDEQIETENIIEVQQIRELLTNLDRTDLLRIFDMLLEIINKKIKVMGVVGLFLTAKAPYSGLWPLDKYIA